MSGKMKKTSHFNVKRWMKFGTVSAIFARKSREIVVEKVRYSNTAPRFQCATMGNLLKSNKLGRPTCVGGGTHAHAHASARPCARLPASARSHPVAVTGFASMSRPVINPDEQKPVRNKI